MQHHRDRWRHPLPPLWFSQLWPPPSLFRPTTGTLGLGSHQLRTSQLFGSMSSAMPGEVVQRLRELARLFSHLPATATAADHLVNRSNELFQAVCRSDLRPGNKEELLR